MTDPLYTIPEVAAELRVSKRTVENLLARGQLRPHRIGRRVLVSRKELDAFLAQAWRRRVA